MLTILDHRDKQIGRDPPIPERERVDSITRQKYLMALREADEGELSDLLIFVRA